MNLKSTLIFLCGVGIGAGSTYLVLKDKYEQQANQDAAESKAYYKELYSNKEETPSEEVEDVRGTVNISEKGDITFTPIKEPLSNVVEARIPDNPLEDDDYHNEPDYDEIINKLNYNQFSTKTPDVNGDSRPSKKPYIISEDEYNVDTKYIKKIISYFEDDGVCLDNDTKEVLDNVPKDLGMDNIERINDEGFDELYIRNEYTGIDYNIVSEPGSYEDYIDAGDE